MTSSLKEHREACDLTQVDLATRIGVSQQTVARWEKETIPSKYLRDLALILHCRVDDLVSGKKPNWPDPTDAYQAMMRMAVGGSESDGADPPALWGAVEIRFPGEETGRLVHDWPITNEARDDIFRGLTNGLGQVSDERDRAITWNVFKTLDNRVVFYNTAVAEEVQLIDEIEEGPGDWEHPEVYRALSDEHELLDALSPPPKRGEDGRPIRDERGDLVVDDEGWVITDKLVEAWEEEYSKPFLATCLDLVKSYGSYREACEALRGIAVQTVEGRRDWYQASWEEDDQAAVMAGIDLLFAEVLHGEDWPDRTTWLEVGRGEGGTQILVRLSSLRLIEVPLVALEKQWEREREDRER